MMECMKLVSCILSGKVFQHIMYMRPVVANIPHYVPYNSSSGGWVGAPFHVNVDVVPSMKRGFPSENVCDGSSERVNIQLTSDLSRNRGKIRGLDAPWELRPNMVQAALEESGLPWLSFPSFPAGLPSLDFSVRQPDRDDMSQKLRTERVLRECEASYQKGVDMNRNVLLFQWAEILQMVPMASTVGIQMLHEASKPDHCVNAFAIVSDVLRSKANNTIKVRAGSMALFCRWFESRFPDKHPFPVREDVVYEYFNELRSSQASASRADTFVSTLNFSAEVFGLQGAADAAASIRVKGAALDMFLNKRPRRRAPEIQPIMIAVLEIAACVEQDPYLRAIAGFCLMCVFGRMRVSDVNRMVNGSVVGNYFEATLLRTKTARSQEKKTTFLPMVSPAYGLLGVNWCVAFFATRRELDLEELPGLATEAYDMNFKLLPSADSLCYTYAHSISTACVNEGLRKLLYKVFPSPDVERLTTHSMKTSLLSFGNKFGFHFETSELLGYHLVAHHSALNYSRDNLAQPMRKLSDMVEHLKSGAFLPMEQRDRMFPEEALREDIVEQLQKYTGKTLEEIAEVFHRGVLHNNTCMSQDEETRYGILYSENVSRPGVSGPLLQRSPLESVSVETDESAELSESSDSGASSVEQGFACVAKALQRGPVRNMSQSADLGVVLRHNRTRMVHLGHIQSHSKLACGRILTESYDLFHGDVDKVFPKCRNCFGTGNP